MKTLSHQHLAVQVLAILAGACLVAMSGSAEAQVAEKGNHTDVLDRILDTWRKRQARIRTVTMEAKGQLLFPEDGCTKDVDDPMYAGGPVPPTDLSHPFSLRMTIDFEKNMFRQERRSAMMSLSRERLGTLVPEEYNAVYNGKLQHHNLNKSWPGEADFRIYQDRESLVLTVTDAPGFFACGLPFLPNEYRSLRPEVVAQHFALKEVSSWRGRRHHVLIHRVPGQKSWTEFWVDVDHGSTVSRWIPYTSSGSVFCRAEMEYDNSMPDPVLTRFELREYGPQERLKRSNAADVSMQFNPVIAPEEFVLEPPVGAAVSDFVAGRQYIAGLDPERSSYFVLIAWLTGGAVVFIMLILLFRSRRRAANQS